MLGSARNKHAWLALNKCGLGNHCRSRKISQKAPMVCCCWWHTSQLSPAKHMLYHTLCLLVGSIIFQPTLLLYCRDSTHATLHDICKPCWRCREQAEDRIQNLATLLCSLTPEIYNLRPPAALLKDLKRRERNHRAQASNQIKTAPATNRFCF